jgi:bifunctional non-homologous end joining protein LigD
MSVWLKDLLATQGLKCFAKTSGSKGLQIYVPLNTPVSCENTKSFAHAAARALEREHPKLITSNMKKSSRGGKVFIDWSQKDEHKTTVNVYSLRAKEYPTVSTPVSWKEVETALKKKNPKVLIFEAEDVLKRVKKFGDLFRPVLDVKQKLKTL